MDKHPIDKIFSDRLNQREYQFSPENWESALSLIQADKKRRKQIFIWWFIAAAVLLSAFIISWNFYSNVSEQEAPSIAAKVDAPDQEMDVMGLSTKPTPSNENELSDAEFSSSVSTEKEKNSPSSLHNPQKNAFSISKEDQISNIQETKAKLSDQPIVSEATFSEMTETIGQGVAEMYELPLTAVPQQLIPLSSHIDHNPSQIELPLIGNERIKPVSFSIVSGWTAQLSADMLHGMLSRPDGFKDLAMRLGYQKAIHQHIALEARTGLRYFNGQLPVHAQVRHIEYLIGAEVTTFQLQANQLMMGGFGLGVHFGHKDHRLSVGFDVDYLFAAHGTMKEQFFIQERKLQDRNAKPLLISEDKSWLSLDGLNQWQQSSEVAYRYSIDPRLEIGLAWVHRFTKFVVNDELPADRMSLTVRKIF